MNRADLKALQIPLLALLLAGLISAAAVYYTNALLDQAREKLTQQEARLREARTRLYRSGEEKELIGRHLGRYRQLQSIGFVGDEQRINWLDGLRLANQQTELFGVDYQISAQRPFPRAGEFNPGQLVLSQSVMKLRFRLLHEEDLLRFFNALENTGAGVFLIDECALRRADPSGTLRYQPNLTAECELSWITARPAVTERKP